MFTGIVETLGKIVNIQKQGSNIQFEIQSEISNTLKIDQSVSHNGVCLTVIALNNNQQTHSVVAIEETLQKTSLAQWEVGSEVNLERCMQMNGRLDGHIVQGHVDQTAICTALETLEGSWKFTFQFQHTDLYQTTVEKGSICVNGVSLTVVDSKFNEFSVCIIPYTFENTVFKHIKVSDVVNLEFDIIGKYVAKYQAYFQEKTS